MDWYLLKRKDIAAILLVVGIVAALFVVYVAIPNIGGQIRTGASVRTGNVPIRATVKSALKNRQKIRLQ